MTSAFSPVSRRRLLSRLAATGAATLAGTGRPAFASEPQTQTQTSSPAAVPTPAPDAAAARDTAPWIVPIGGALRFDHDAVWSRLVALAGGAGARIAVFGTASSHPAEAAAQAVDALRRRGADAVEIPLAPGPDAAAATRNPRLVETVRGARGVFFCGGAQERLVDVLAPAGAETPLLRAVRDVAARGGLVAGTSAGAAVMSTTMFRDAQDTLSVLKGRLRAGREIDAGLGFVGPELFVDQHFLRRGRIGRMLPLMVARGYQLGLGVDEDSAAIVHAGEVEAIGARGALVVDLRDATPQPVRGAFGLRGARLTYVDRGDRFHLARRELLPSAAKRAGTLVEPNAPGFDPYYPHARPRADILADNAIVSAMCELLDSADRETVGLAFDPRPAPGDPHPGLGFEFRLYKAADTRGWFTGAMGGEDYSVADLRLDVRPVRIARPIVSTWAG
jgi:cyanophycinase